MKRAIVTGANGFIGSAVVNELVSHGVEVWAVVRNKKSCISRIRLDPLVHICFCELSEMCHLPEKINDKEFDVFYHFAWDGCAGNTRANTQLQLDNVQWSVDALQVAKKMKCLRFIGAGSIMEHEAISVLKMPGYRPGLEHVYGSAKQAAHIMCSAVAADINIDFIWAEITNVYGVGESSPRLINSTIRKVLNGENVQFTSGTQNCDFVYIDDVARAFYLIGENGHAFCRYVIGSGTAKPLRDFLVELQEIIDPEARFELGLVQSNRVSVPMENFFCKETRDDTGFCATTSFREGVEKTIQWIKEEQNE